MTEPSEMTDLEKIKNSIEGIQRANEWQAKNGIEEGVANEMLDIAAASRPDIMNEELMDVITYNTDVVLEKNVSQVLELMKSGRLGDTPKGQLAMLFKDRASQTYDAVVVEFDKQGNVISSQELDNDPATIERLKDAAREQGLGAALDDNARALPVLMGVTP